MYIIEAEESGIFKLSSRGRGKTSKIIPIRDPYICLLYTSPSPRD